MSSVWLWDAPSNADRVSAAWASAAQLRLTRFIHFGISTAHVYAASRDDALVSAAHVSAVRVRAARVSAARVSAARVSAACVSVARVVAACVSAACVIAARVSDACLSTVRVSAVSKLRAWDLSVQKRWTWTTAFSILWNEKYGYSNVFFLFLENLESFIMHCLKENFSAFSGVFFLILYFSLIFTFFGKICFIYFSLFCINEGVKCIWALIFRRPTPCGSAQN